MVLPPLSPMSVSTITPNSVACISAFTGTHNEAGLHLQPYIMGTAGNNRRRRPGLPPLCSHARYPRPIGSPYPAGDPHTLSTRLCFPGGREPCSSCPCPSFSDRNTRCFPLCPFFSPVLQLRQSLPRRQAPQFFDPYFFLRPRDPYPRPPPWVGPGWTPPGLHKKPGPPPRGIGSGQWSQRGPLAIRRGSQTG